jgi:hypothetical protein
MTVFDIKVGSGFSFLLFYALVIAYALFMKASFAEVVPWLFAGLGVQTGQRTYTQVALSKAGCPPPVNDAASNGSGTK